jgi:hypothetical protein
VNVIMESSFNGLDHHTICHLSWYFLVEKMEESACRIHFNDRLVLGPKFGKLGSKTLWIHFEASNNIFWLKNY